MKLAAHGTITDLVNPEIASPYGFQIDNFSARINPRATLCALVTYLQEKIVIMEKCRVAAIFPEEGCIQLETRERIKADKIIIANGYEAYPLLQPLMNSFNAYQTIGKGVKGQAMLVSFNHQDNIPIIYHDGVYIVPHKGNIVAVGSTSREEWRGGANKFDEEDIGFYKKATKLVPALEDAPIIEKWAGVRPRNTLQRRGTAPWFGLVPGFSNVVALIGGFKITFGIAHLKLSDFEQMLYPRYS